MTSDWPTTYANDSLSDMSRQTRKIMEAVLVTWGNYWLCLALLTNRRQAASAQWPLTGRPNRVFQGSGEPFGSIQCSTEPEIRLSTNAVTGPPRSDPRSRR